MHLEGSCHCGAVRFSLEANSPVPFMHCHCSICRKTAGGGGYAINLGGDARDAEGARREAPRLLPRDAARAGPARPRSKAERRFCLRCGSALWLWDPRWPELVHPHASAIDTPLPKPPEVVEAALDFVAALGRCAERPRPCGAAATWPDESLEDWHKRHGLLSP